MQPEMESRTEGNGEQEGGAPVKDPPRGSALPRQDGQMCSGPKRDLQRDIKGDTNLGCSQTGGCKAKDPGSGNSDEGRKREDVPTSQRTDQQDEHKIDRNNLKNGTTAKREKKQSGEKRKEGIIKTDSGEGHILIPSNQMGPPSARFKNGVVTRVTLPPLVQNQLVPHMQPLSPLPSIVPNHMIPRMQQLPPIPSVPPMSPLPPAPPNISEAKKTEANCPNGNAPNGLMAPPPPKEVIPLCYMSKELMSNNGIIPPVGNFPLNTLSFTKEHFFHNYEEVSRMNESCAYIPGDVTNAIYAHCNNRNFLPAAEGYIVPYDSPSCFYASPMVPYPFFSYRNVGGGKLYCEADAGNDLRSSTHTQSSGGSGGGIGGGSSGQGSGRSGSGSSSLAMANYEETHQMYHACDRVVCAPRGVLQDKGFFREKGVPHKKGYHVDSPSSGMSASDKVGGVGGVSGVSGGVLVQKGAPPFSVSSPREFGLMAHPSSGSLNSTSNVSANNNTHIFNCVNYVSNSNLNVRKFLLNDSTPTSVNDCQQNISYYNTFNTNCFLSASKTYFCNHFLHDCPLPPFPFIDAYNSPPSVTYVPSGALHCPGNSSVAAAQLRKNVEVKNLHGCGQNAGRRTHPQKKYGYPNRDGYLSPIEFSGNIFNIAKDQTGCRILQRILERKNPRHVQEIYREALDNIVELMVDPFGNYLCQKLMEVCTSEQIERIIDAAADQLVSASVSVHGTRTVQKLIEMIRTPAQIAKATRALQNSVITLIKDINGNHVVQKCLVSLTSHQCEFIYKAILNNCVEVSTHRHGCCVIQRCIDSANEQQKALFIRHITDHTLELVQDAFGNYVVQYVLNLGREKVNLDIVHRLLPNLEELATQKFASNVVEKCLTIGSSRCRKILINDILRRGKDSMKKLILDRFGNYVIQRALSVASEPELTKLVEGIKPYIKELRNISSGKRIAWKLAQKHPLLCIDVNSYYQTGGGTTPNLGEPIDDSVEPEKMASQPRGENVPIQVDAPRNGHKKEDEFDTSENMQGGSDPYGSAPGGGPPDAGGPLTLEVQRQEERSLEKSQKHQTNDHHGEGHREDHQQDHRQDHHDDHHQNHRETHCETHCGRRHNDPGYARRNGRFRRKKGSKHSAEVSRDGRSVETLSKKDDRASNEGEKPFRKEHLREVPPKRSNCSKGGNYSNGCGTPPVRLDHAGPVESVGNRNQKTNERGRGRRKRNSDRAKGRGTNLTNDRSGDPNQIISGELRGKHESEVDPLGDGANTFGEVDPLRDGEDHFGADDLSREGENHFGGHPGEKKPRNRGRGRRRKKKMNNCGVERMATCVDTVGAVVPTFNAKAGGAGHPFEAQQGERETNEAVIDQPMISIIQERHPNGDHFKGYTQMNRGGMTVRTEPAEEIAEEIAKERLAEPRRNKTRAIMQKSEGRKVQVDRVGNEPCGYPVGVKENFSHGGSRHDGGGHVEQLAKAPANGATCGEAPQNEGHMVVLGDRAVHSQGGAHTASHMAMQSGLTPFRQPTSTPKMPLSLGNRNGANGTSGSSGVNSRRSSRRARKKF